MAMAHRRGNSAPINCDTCFVPAYHPFGKASDKQPRGWSICRGIREGAAGGRRSKQSSAIVSSSVNLAEAKSVIEEAQRRTLSFDHISLNRIKI
jgi:hypothetical protein